VKLETRAPQGGRRRFRGRLVDFEDQVARLLIDGEEVEIAFADVARANAVYEFTREDFAKRASR
jgi:ribosome maturation factor RimP